MPLVAPDYFPIVYFPTQIWQEDYWQHGFCLGFDSSLYFYRHRFWKHVPEPPLIAPDRPDIDWSLDGSRIKNIEESIEGLRELLKKIKKEEK